MIWLLLFAVGTLATPYAPLTHEVVTNHDDYIVGQILSESGTMVNVPVNGSVNVCLNIDPGIPRDPENLYDVKDFGGYNATFYGPEGEKWWPVDLEITMVGNYSQFCADVTQTGTYYPILTRADWANATGVPPTAVPTTSSPTSSSPTTASPTASPTTVSPTLSPTASPTITITNVPTPSPTHHPESSALLWVGIALGSVFLIVLVVIVCSMFCRKPKEQVDIEEQYAYREPRYKPVIERRHGFKLK